MLFGDFRDQFNHHLATIKDSAKVIPGNRGDTVGETTFAESVVPLSLVLSTFATLRQNLGALERAVYSRGTNEG